jgi:hypothetical protein
MVLPDRDWAVIRAGRGDAPHKFPAYGPYHRDRAVFEIGNGYILGRVGFSWVSVTIPGSRYWFEVEYRSGLFGVRTGSFFQSRCNAGFNPDFCVVCSPVDLHLFEERATVVAHRYSSRLEFFPGVNFRLFCQWPDFAKHDFTIAGRAGAAEWRPFRGRRQPADRALHCGFAISDPLLGKQDSPAWPEVV